MNPTPTTISDYYTSQGKTLGATAADRLADPAFAAAAKAAGYDSSNYQVNTGNATANTAILQNLLKGSATATPPASTTTPPAGTTTVGTPNPDPNAMPPATPDSTAMVPRTIYNDANMPALVTAQTEEDLQAKKRAAAQDQINSLNQYYDTLANESRVLGAKNSRSTDSISTLTGLSGSSEAGVQAAATDSANKADLDKVENQRNVAIQSVLSDISKSAVAEAQQSRLEARQSEQDRLDYRTKAQQEAVTNLTTLAKSNSGATLEGLKATLNPDEYNTLINNAGGESMAKAILFENRPTNTLVGTPTTVGDNVVQYFKTPEGKIISENVPLPTGVTANSIKSIEKAGDGSLVIIKNDGTWTKLSGTEKPASDASGTGGVSDALQSAINNGTIDPNRINSRTLGIYNAIAAAGTDAVGSHAGAAGETKAITDLSTYKSTATRTLGVLESNLPLVENLADSVNKTGVPGIDRIIAGAQTYTGNNPDVIKYVNSLKTLRAEYAQMLAKGNAATEGDKADAAEAIPAGLTSAGYASLGEQLKLEANNILKASDDAISAAKDKSASNNGAGTGNTADPLGLF